MKKILVLIALVFAFCSCKHNVKSSEDNICSYTVVDTVVNNTDTCFITYTCTVKDTVINGKHITSTVYNKEGKQSDCQILINGVWQPVMYTNWKCTKCYVGGKEQDASTCTLNSLTFYEAPDGGVDICTKVIKDNSIISFSQRYRMSHKTSKSITYFEDGDKDLNRIYGYDDITGIVTISTDGKDTAIALSAHGWDRTKNYIDILMVFEK